MAVGLRTIETLSMAGVRFGTSLTYLGVYVLAVLVGRSVVPAGTGLALFWPAAGVAALWMLRGRTRDQVTLDALLLFLGTTATNLALDVDLVPALLFGLANLVQGYVVRLVSAWLEKLPVTADLSPGVRTSRDLWELAMGSVLAAAASCPIGTTGAWISSGHWSWSTVAAWLVRNACGTFVVAAAALAMAGARRERTMAGKSVVGALTAEPRPHVAWELVAATVVTVGSGVLVFASQQQLPIAFVMIATSAWIGFRFAPVVGGVHTLVFGAIAVVCSLEGWGPFGEISDLTTRSVVVQLFVAVTAVITLMLSLGVAERGRLTDQLRTSEARAHARAEMLYAVTDAMADGLAVIDSAGNVVLSNPAAVALTAPQVDQGRVEGARSHGLYRPDGTDLPDEEMPHVRALEGHAVPATDLLRVDPVTGVQSLLSFTAVPLHDTDPDGEVRAVMLIRDVSRERAQTRELQAFAGVVAHDLQNPLTSLMSWSEILDEQLDGIEEEAAATARASLVKIYRSADKMQQLISDLLMLSQARSAEIRPVSVSLDAVVDTVAHDIADHVFALRPRIEHGPLGSVRADATLVRQVFANLFGNAVKYVEPGVQPVVRVSSRMIGEMVEIRVTDNGLGIPPHEQGRIFDSFFRSSSTAAYPGTGLGLSITARAIERHGGRISARDGQEGGTTFIFTLPSDDTRSLGAQREGRTTSAEPPPRRTGSETAVS